MAPYLIIIVLLSILIFLCYKYGDGNWALPAILLILGFCLCTTTLTVIIKFITSYLDMHLNAGAIMLIVVLILGYVLKWLFHKESFKIIIPSDYNLDYFVIMHRVPNAPKYGPIPFLFPKVIKLKIPKDGIYRTSYKDDDVFKRHTRIYLNKKKVYDSKFESSKIIHSGNYKRCPYKLMFFSNDIKDQDDIDKIFDSV
jgi:hypothetical protein